jgi:GlpG protein
MRLIGHLKNEASAKTLADYLVSLDIRNLIEPDGTDWAVWIYSEDQIEAGQKALAGYLQNPADNKYRVARQSAALAEERMRQEKARFESRMHTREQIWTSTSLGPVTLALIIISAVVTLLASLTLPFSVQDWVCISQYTGRGLPEVRQGEIWRLITPIFLHFGILHIVFNMLMLRDMGTLVELRQSPRTLIILVLVLGVGSNLGQYYYAGGGFGGMSGVLYGLLGYIWLRGQCDPSSGLRLSPTTLALMLIWFVLCLVNVIPNVANACHAVGLVMGMLIGAAPMLNRASR